MAYGVHAFVVALGVMLVSASARSEPSDSDKGHRELTPASDAGGPPPGYHRETRLRSGLVIGGGIASGVGAAMFIGGLEQRRHSQAQPPGDNDPESGGEFFMITGGLSLAVGLPMLTYGLLVPREVYVRDSLTSVSLHLVAGPELTGPELRLTF